MNRERFKALFPRASEDTIKANTNEDIPDVGLQNTLSERDSASALGCSDTGKTKSTGRTTVWIISYRCRLLDTDNFYGGCKQMCDCLKEAGLIEDDSPEHIKLETEQVKVGHRGEERTQIILQYGESASETVP